jgi:hypothetical protein
MANLGDYLGQLLAEIAMARLQADLETVRLAELYAAHPLLRNMAVPRVRLPEVDIDLPVLIQASEAPREGETTRGGTATKQLADRIDQVIGAHLSKSGINLAQAQRNRVRTSLHEQVAAHGHATETGIDTRRLADGLTEVALRSLSTGTQTSRLRSALKSGALAKELREAVRIEVLKLRTPPPRLQALVTSAEIREQGNTVNVARLKLKVSEQGMEWATTETDGGTHDQLVPE